MLAKFIRTNPLLKIRGTAPALQWSHIMTGSDSAGVRENDNREELVFVYGTLKKGEPNEEIMRDESTGRHRFIGYGRTKTAYPLIIASKYNIPFCLQQPGAGHRIKGEVYAVDETKLQALDELEDHPTFYKRQKEQIELESGSEISAWIYMLPVWKPDLLKNSTDYLENYTSSGSHSRPYVSRYVRNKRLEEEGRKLATEITGRVS